MSGAKKKASHNEKEEHVRAFQNSTEQSTKTEKKTPKKHVLSDKNIDLKSRSNIANQSASPSNNSKQVKKSEMRSSESIDEIKQITSTPKKLKASVDENGNLNEPKAVKSENKENNKSIVPTSPVNTVATTSKAAASNSAKPAAKKTKYAALTADQIDEIEQVLAKHKGTCSQISSSRFNIAIGYHRNLIDIFRSVTDRRYDVSNKTWNFPNQHYDDLLDQLKNFLNQESNTDSLGSVKVTILKDNRFDVDMANLKKDVAKLEDVFKTIASGVYDSVTKHWSFELKDHNDLVNRIQAKFQQNITIFDIESKIKKIIGLTNQATPADAPINFEDLKDKIDSTIVEALLPFQIESVCFAIKKEGKVLLADDMGLGKTLQALAVASYYSAEWPMIIIAPSSVKHMWQANALKWLPNTLSELSGGAEDLASFIQVIENGKESIDPDCLIYIISYDLLGNRIDEFVNKKFKIMIADESHLVKTARAKRTLAVQHLAELAERVLLLSGTPALSRPSELFTQIQMISPGLFGDFNAYGKRYCNGYFNDFGWDFSGASNSVELKLIMEETLMIRHDKKEIMSKLVKKTREKVVLKNQLVDLSAESLGAAAERMHNSAAGIEHRSALFSYFHETCKAKSQAVADYVCNVLKKGEKIIVFAHHKEMLDELERMLDKNKHKYIRIDGSTNSKKRQTQVNMFQSKDNFVCALLSITAAGTGITLTKANLVIFAELFWNPGSIVQAEDRAYRIGQTKPVHIQYLLAEQTVDTIMWPLINNKLSVLNKIGLTNEDLARSVDDHTTETSALAQAIQEVIDNEPEPQPEQDSNDSD